MPVAAACVQARRGSKRGNVLVQLVQEINSLKGMLCLSCNQQMYQQLCPLEGKVVVNHHVFLSSVLIIQTLHLPAGSCNVLVERLCFLILNNSVCVHYVNKQLN